MTTLFTADTQIQHRLTATLRGFGSTAEHDAHIADVWRATVRPTDTVWLVGDAHLGNVTTAMDFYRVLPGRKILVAGNHDQCHPMHAGSVNQVRRYAEAFDAVVQSARWKQHGLKFLVSHFPYEGDSHIDCPDRHEQWRLADHGTPIIHGHVHSPERVTRSSAGSIQMHVGWDAWGRPVSADELLAHYPV